MQISEIIASLKAGQNLIVYGPNNSGKTTLLNDINRIYNDQNAKNFVKDSEEFSPCVFIPAKRVYEFSDVDGIKANKDSLTLDIIQRFGQEWAEGSFIFSIREKIRNSNFASVLASKCKTVFDIKEFDPFDVRCSDGVQNVVNILSYVFHVLDLYNPEATIQQLLNTKFLLVIDEIELYLYIQSMSNFLDVLSSTFKKATMVFSSHSALVMQRLKGFRVLKISGLNVFEDSGPSPYFQDLGSILEPYYGVKEYPSELEQFAQSIEKAIIDQKVDESIKQKVFEEADKLRNDYPGLSGLITDLQLHFVKRLKKREPDKCNE